MRTLLLLLLSVSLLPAVSAPSPAQLWDELKIKREGLKTFHQEFEVSRTFRTREHNQSSKWPVTLDAAKEQWREVSLVGSGTHIRVFDGNDLFSLEEGNEEYVRVKLSKKDDSPEPHLYETKNFEWSKAVERGRMPCGLSTVNHQCVSIEVPLKASIRNIPGSSDFSRTLEGGSESIILDLESGLILGSRSIQTVENPHSTYQSDTTYKLKRLSYGGTVDEKLFELPASATVEVKELSPWNAARMKKVLTGKPASDFALKDLHGNAIHLADLKGKTVLLDFWATWCGPCRADGPSIDKLYQKYSDKNLMIIGISVDEDRSVVEKFLSEHPHSYPIALTTENEMPRAYQVGVFPTYIVVDSDGNFASATEGNTGFSDLRKLLKKAGLETD